jgi:hypothetical protein
MPQRTPPNVEAIMAALETLLSTLTPSPLQTVTRVWQPWDQLQSVLQPALVIVKPKEKERQSTASRPIVELQVKLVVYFQVNNQDQTTTPDTVMNNILFAIRQALLPSGADLGKNSTTLGGLVQAVLIDGDILQDAGVLDQQASMFIPLKILIP